MGLYGRVCLGLGMAPALHRQGKGALPAHGFGVGDEVAVSAMKGPGGKKVQVTVRCEPVWSNFILSDVCLNERAMYGMWATPAGVVCVHPSHHQDETHSTTVFKRARRAW